MPFVFERGELTNRFTAKLRRSPLVLIHGINAPLFTQTSAYPTRVIHDLLLVLSGLRSSLNT